MSKFILSLCLLFFCSSVFANQIDTRGLTEAQVAELKAEAARKAAENVAGNPGNITAGVTLAATWGTQAAAAAEGFSKALGIAARELNVTINDFLASPAGILTAALIIWYMAGSTILGLLYGMIILTVGISFVRFIYLRLFTKEFVEVKYSRLWGLWDGSKMVRVPKTFQDLHNEGEWMMVWIMIAITVLSLWIAGAVIF